MEDSVVIKRIQKYEEEKYTSTMFTWATTILYWTILNYLLLLNYFKRYLDCDGSNLDNSFFFNISRTDFFENLTDQVLKNLTDQNLSHPAKKKFFEPF